MFFHAMKYTFLALIRDKSSVFWCFAFPLLLGTMFHFAFGGLDTDESFSPIAVGVVIEESQGADSIRTIFDTLSAPGDDQLLIVTYATAEEALDLLEKKEIYGIITADIPELSDYFSADLSEILNTYPLQLTLSAEMNSDPLYQSILNCFVEQFNLQYQTISTIAMEHPFELPALIESIEVDTNYLIEESLGANSLTESSTYFFNLIAMTCMFAATVGNVVAIHNQANLSSLGARRNVSPVHRMVSILGDLSAVLIFEFITLLTALFYFTAVLGVDFGKQFGFVALTALCGCLTGISLGFFVGSIGRFNQNIKFGILMAVIMFGCFLSGLMVGNMRVIVDGICPFINHINPSALISDALYSLAIYPSYKRFFTNIASLLLISALLCVGGFTMVRRKKYASL